ncbi:low molecular weight protein arginine phosphatase [Paenibacillus sp. HB172176]|uniref:low molecular weight protein arginine phosphatase n=1 Tax=Paenibacillus sp. HB172176 TaxID=2493690 RepID=UPI00197EFE25|nr:low molecular weight protein arginine phosphatase [Paenibacillus sp. HB172176]
MKRILFVCTGNTCRSPMAEALLRQMARQRGITLAVRSAGVSTVDGLPVSRQTLETLRRRDIDHTGTSRAMTAEAINWADLILTMTSGHKRDLIHRHPASVDKVYTLKEFANQDESVLADISEMEQLYTEMQMKAALGGQLTPEERGRLLELERRIPSFDIADPFGGPQSLYDATSEEIEEAVRQLLDKLTRRGQ